MAGSKSWYSVLTDISSSDLTGADLDANSRDNGMNTLYRQNLLQVHIMTCTGAIDINTLHISVCRILG